MFRLNRHSQNSLCLNKKQTKQKKNTTHSNTFATFIPADVVVVVIGRTTRRWTSTCPPRIAFRRSIETLARLGAKKNIGLSHKSRLTFTYLHTHPQVNTSPRFLETWHTARRAQPEEKWSNTLCTNARVYNTGVHEPPRIFQRGACYIVHTHMCASGFCVCVCIRWWRTRCTFTARHARTTIGPRHSVTIYPRASLL